MTSLDEVLAEIEAMPVDKYPAYYTVRTYGTSGLRSRAHSIYSNQILKVWVRTLVKMYADADSSRDYIPPIIRAELCRQAKKDGDCVEILAVALPREVKS